MWRASSSSAFPSLAKALARARPMPELAPVITTSGLVMAVPSVGVALRRDATLASHTPPNTFFTPAEDHEGRGRERLASASLRVQVRSTGSSPIEYGPLCLAAGSF